MLSWPLADAANPYVSRLTEALTHRGVRVRAHRYLAALCARPEGARWLHIHWPEWMIHDLDRGRYRARVRWLLGLLDMARAQGVSLAWTAHNLFGHDDPHADLGALARRALLSRCEVVFGAFTTAEQCLRNLGFQGRFILTPHPHAGDDHGFIEDRARCRREASVGEGETLLVSFGSLEKYKGLSGFGRCLERVRGELQWVIAGRCKSESERDALRAVASRDPRVTLREGFVSPAGLTRLITAADAVVLPYRAYFTSGAAMLALTLGTSVIAPPYHHFRAWSREPFMVSLPETTVECVGRAVSQASELPSGTRAVARRFATQTSFGDIAETIDQSLFGGAP